MTTSPKNWLAHFLRQRDLQEPDGRVLYAYRLEEQEYDSLRSILGIMLSDYVLSSNGHLAPGTAELFVLYGAAWWEREYAGGAWRWDDVLSSFGSDPDGWTPQFRTQCVQLGLRYWKQQIPNSGKKFFGVLVEQGGLPRVLLAKSKGNISGLIRTVLKRAARLGAEVDEIAAMLPDYKEKLPASLQNDAVYLLIAQVVGTVLELKREFKLNKGDNAVARLDQLAPSWRMRFPLALDDQAAVALLGDLVGEAAAIDAENRAAPVVAERLLVEESGVYRLVSRVEYPKLLSAESLSAFVGIDESALPFRIAVDLQLDKRYPSADIRKALGPGPSRFQFTNVRSQWAGDAALCEHLLCLNLPGNQWVGVPVPGGIEMAPESPWVFVSEGEETRLVAQGSAKIRQEHGYVIIDDNWKVEIEGPGGRIERSGKFVSESLSKAVIKVHGTVLICDGTNTFKIRTGQAGAEAERPAWEGRRFGFTSSPSLAFHGVPKLCRYTADGVREVVPAHELEWRVAGTSRAVSATTARGPVDVLWRKNGELRLRNRMVIIDRQPLRFQSGVSITEGSINIPATWGVDAVNAEDRSLNLSCRRDTDWLSVIVNAQDNPPEFMQLVLDWRTCPIPWRLSLPFPASGGRFFDKDERRLDDSAAITRDQLLGVRLRLFDSDPDHPVQHKLVFSLLSTGGERSATNVPPIEHVLQLNDNRAEVRMIDHQNDINSLLCQTDALDAVVTVTLWAGRKQATTLLVKRYEFALIPDGLSVSISPADMARLPTAALSEIELSAIPIATIHHDSGIKLTQQLSEGVPTGRWNLPENTIGRQWLIYPAVGAGHSFRALLISNGYTPSPVPIGYVPAPTSIEEILQIGDPARRREILGRRLDALAEDFLHPDWQIVEGTWSNLGHLTLPTLDLWRAFALNPVALAALACRFRLGVSQEQVMDMCGRFQSELGVLWETVPLSAWYAACTNLNRQYSHLMPTAEPTLITQLVAATLRGIRLHFPALNTLLAYVSYMQTGQEVEIMAPLIKTKLTELKARLWLGEDAAIQTIMLRNSAERRPLRLPIYEDIFAKLDISEADAKTVFSVLWDPNNPKAGIANMPLLLALCTCNGYLRPWWKDTRRLIELRQYRDYDRDWFSHAFDQAVAMFIIAGIVTTSTPNNQ